MDLASHGSHQDNLSGQMLRIKYPIDQFSKSLIFSRDIKDEILSWSISPIPVGAHSCLHVILQWASEGHWFVIFDESFCSQMRMRTKLASDQEHAGMVNTQ